MAIEMQQVKMTHLIESLPSDQFSMIAEIVKDQEYERVMVPGVIVQGGDPEFVSGVAWGRTAYFDTVIELLDVDGNAVHEFTLEELEHLHEVKTHDITIADAVKLIMETAYDSHGTPEWRAGFIFGYVTACSDQFYGVACESCHKHCRGCRCVVLASPAM